MAAMAVGALPSDGGWGGWGGAGVLVGALVGGVARRAAEERRKRVRMSAGGSVTWGCHTAE